ncbi:IS3 family transposase [Bacillus paralicheniformis]|uniref:IS3 family transposase n=1 Tax=Bacillus paralicheniformis TaxID=1648923 RepID=UPI003703EFB8
MVFTFYNHDRLQEKLNGLSPAEYRAKAVKCVFVISTVYLTGGSSRRAGFSIYRFFSLITFQESFGR